MQANEIDIFPFTHSFNEISDLLCLCSVSERNEITLTRDVKVYQRSRNFTKTVSLVKISLYSHSSY